jgi:hypothetical protein
MSVDENVTPGKKVRSPAARRARALAPLESGHGVVQILVPLQ